MEEIWKDIIGYEGLYEISSYGRIRRNGKFLDFNRSKKIRYTVICLYKSGKRQIKYLHRLVAETFLEGPQCCSSCGFKFEVNHKDENKANNHASNLEFVTRQENMSLGLQKRIRRFVSARCSAKLTIEQVQSLRNEVANSPDSKLSIAKKYGISKSQIYRILRGKCWSPTS